MRGRGLLGRVDDVEAEPSVWEPDGAGSGAIWGRTAGTTDGHFWRGEDVGHTSDTSLISPPLKVGDQPLVVRFDHAHKFEQADGTNFDGGVVEVSSDDGETWVDVATLAEDVGYQGTIAAMTNPLDTRPAFVGENPGYPGRDRVEIDLGTGLAGKTVRLRFRIGTDAGVGAPGWDIDNIAFAGITNTPFPTWADDPGCGAGDSDAPTTSDSADSDEDSSGGPDQQAEDGCGCVAVRPDAASLVVPWLAVVGLGWRRRQRPR